MKAFQASMAKLEGADTQVLGVSIDSPFANHAFAMQNGITFPILGDMNAKAIKAYGLEKEYHIGGATMASARRATFLIDKEGKVVEEQVDSDAVDPTKIVDACQLRQKAKELWRAAALAWIVVAIQFLGIASANRAVMDAR